MRILKIIYNIIFTCICVSVPLVCALLQWLQVGAMLMTVVMFLYLTIGLKVVFYVFDKLDAIDEAECEINDFLNNN